MRIDKRHRERSDGTRYIRFVADAGKNPFTKRKERKEFPTKREAQEYLDAIRQERKAGPKSEITVRELGTRYVENRRTVGKKSPSTYEKYAQHFRNHICKLVLTEGVLQGTTLGDHRLRDLEQEHFQQLSEDLDRTLSVSMSRKVWATLRRAIDYAVAKRWVPGNALRLVAREKIKFKRAKIPPTRDLTKILEKLPWSPGDPVYFGLVYVMTALKSGLRPGEQRALRWSNVRVDKKPYEIEVVEAIDERGKLKGPKTDAGRRIIPIPTSLAVLLRAWKPVCPKSITGLVFPTQGGTYFGHSNLHSRVWKPIQIAAGVCDPRKDRHGITRMRGRYDLYVLRHVYASAQIASGVLPKVLSKNMGHESVAFTMQTYVWVWDDHKADPDKADKWFSEIKSAG